MSQSSKEIFVYGSFLSGLKKKTAAKVIGRQIQISKKNFLLGPPKEKESYWVHGAIVLLTEDEFNELTAEMMKAIGGTVGVITCYTESDKSTILSEKACETIISEQLIIRCNDWLFAYADDKK